MSNQEYKKRKITDFFQRLDAKASSSLSSASPSGDNKETTTVLRNDNVVDDQYIEAAMASSDLDDFEFETEPINEKIKLDDAEQNQEFITLTDILTDDNNLRHIDEISNESDTFLLCEISNDNAAITCNATNYVKLPHQDGICIELDGTMINKWKLIRQLLLSPNKIANFYELEKAIKTYNPSIANLQFDIFRSYVMYQMTEDEQTYFFDQLLPSIIRLALELPDLIKGNVPLLDQGSSSAVFLSQLQISSLLANAFLCTYNSRFKDDPRCINFVKLYCTNNNEKRKGSKLEKLKCLLNYFRRIGATATSTGVVSFERKQLDTRSMPAPEESSMRLSKFEINSKLCMFENGDKYAQVDFANRNIGGGVLNSGAVQEEIMFCLCPELIVSRLFTEKMLDGDAVIITGVERFNTHEGYGDKFKWNASYDDSELPRDRYRRKARQVIAMDALPFHWRNVSAQYEKGKIDRELRKAIVAFKPERFLVASTRAPTIATGNWGCGVYRGNPYLKTLIQMMAAAVVGRDLVYYAYENDQLKCDFERVKRLLDRATPPVTVSSLYRATLQFAALKRESSNINLIDFLRDQFS